MSSYSATVGWRTSNFAPPRSLVTAAINLFNCRYLGRAVAELQRRGNPPDPALLPHLSPLGWDRINLTGDYVWSDRLEVDDQGLMPLLIPER